MERAVAPSYYSRWPAEHRTVQGSVGIMLPRLRGCTLLEAQTFAELQSLPRYLCAWPLQYVSHGLAARQMLMSWPSVSNLSTALPTEGIAIALHCAACSCEGGCGRRLLSRWQYCSLRCKLDALTTTSSPRCTAPGRGWLPFPACPAALLDGMGNHGGAAAGQPISAGEAELSVAQHFSQLPAASPPDVIQKRFGRLASSMAPPAQELAHMQAKAARAAAAEGQYGRQVPPAWALAHLGGLPPRVRAALAELAVQLDPYQLGLQEAPARKRMRLRKPHSPSCSPAV
jgi:hypothetical protein